MAALVRLCFGVFLLRVHVPFFQISYYSLAIILVSVVSSYFCLAVLYSHLWLWFHTYLTTCIGMSKPRHFHPAVHLIFDMITEYYAMFVSVYPGPVWSRLGVHCCRKRLVDCHGEQPRRPRPTYYQVQHCCGWTSRVEAVWLVPLSHGTQLQHETPPTWPHGREALLLPSLHLPL